MELNKQTAIDKNMQDILSANNAREEADILAAIKTENEMADISEIDNGYTNITRAFFSAAHANKDSDENRTAAIEKEAAEERTQSMYQSMVQDLVQRNREFQEEIFSGIQKNLDSARQDVMRYEARLEQIQEDRAALLERAEELKDEKENAIVAVEVTQEMHADAKAEEENAVALQEVCADVENANMCKAELGMDKNATQTELNEKLEEGVLAAKANVADTTALVGVANDNLASTEQQQEQVKAALVKTGQEEAVTIKGLDTSKTRSFALQRSLDDAKTRSADFNRTIEADLKSGKITPEEAAQRSAEFNNGLRNQASAPSASQSALAANNDSPNTARPTASAASALNDGGGIKAGSIQNQFASAALGMDHTPVLDPERRLVYAPSAPSMALG